MNEVENIREQEQKIDRTKILYMGYKTTFDFGDAIRNGIITMYVPNNKQGQLPKKVTECTSNTRL